MTATFKDHSRQFEEFSVVYPVVSRRAGGVSLGINLNPNGACNYKCVYCQVPRFRLDASVSDPKIPLILKECDWLYEMIKDGRLFDLPRFSQTPAHLREIKDISLSGDGEPSLYAKLATLLPFLQERAQKWGVSLQIISNGKGLLRPDVLPELEKFRPGKDRVWLKADAWNDEDMKSIYDIKEEYQLHRQQLEDILANVRCWLQLCVYLKGDQIYSCESPKLIGRQIQRWGSHYKQLEAVQIYTLARETFQSGLKALSDDQLKEWVAKVKSEVRLPVKAYGEQGLLE